jgi:predicted AlkP superfamily pyrophosphatase or phosphodiesterase
MRVKFSLTPVLLALTLLLGACATGTSKKQEGSGGINALEHRDKPYLVVVSLDGFRWDYPERFQPTTIRRMIDSGFRAERLLPVFPTLTFPNHYSIATGLYPERHGIVGNRFYAPEFDLWYELSNRETVEDGRFYSGEPIWVTAEKQGMVSAAFFFVGTEAAIQGIRPTHWYSFSKSHPGEARVDQAIAWLKEPEAGRPHLVTLYFEDVDDQSHWNGVGSEPAVAAVHRVDRLLERLMTGIRALPHGDQVNVLVVSDHGQSGYPPEGETLVLGQHIDLAGIRVVGKGSYSQLYYSDSEAERVRDDQETLRQAWNNGRVLTPGDAPAEWNIGDNPRWPDLIVQPDPGYRVVRHADQIESINPGDHGWPPEFTDMHGVLFGTGPAFRPGASTGPVRVVDIYPLMLSVLGLKGPGPIDGNPEALEDILVAGPTEPSARD